MLRRFAPDLRTVATGCHLGSARATFHGDFGLFDDPALIGGEAGRDEFGRYGGGF